MESGRTLVVGLSTALVAHAGVVSAYLFGSESLGLAHRESDVDVGVLLDRRLYPQRADRFDARLHLIGILQTAAGREVDLVVLNDAPPHLARRIMTEGRRLMVTDPVLDHAHLRTMLSRAADLEPFLRRTRAVKLAALAR
jgi:predicted nucleotidyltransferase